MKIRDSRHRDVEDIDIEDKDVLEASRLDLDILRNMHRTIDIAVYKKTAFYDEIPVAMWGAVGDLFGSGMPYLVVSKQIRLVNTREFITIYRQEVREMLKLFPRLENVVDAEYDNAVRMLKIVGFKISSPVPIFPLGPLFRKFQIEVN